MNQQGYGPHPPSGGATQNDHRGGSTHDPVASIASWAKGVASDNLDEIKAGFNLQKAAIDLDEARNNKNKGSPQFRRRRLENIVCLGTGSFLVIAPPNSTKLSFVCGMGGFTDSLVSVSEHDGKNIGMISDRTEHSEAAPGAVDWVGMNKYYTVEACDSVIELSTFYGDAQNRLKRFDVSDSSTRAYKFMPGFLVLPQELIAWFLEAEPTAYELHEKLLGLVGTGQAPDELQVALNWCVCVCCCDNDTAGFRQGATPILFTQREQVCASWFKQRVDLLLGPRTARPQALPATPGPAPPTQGTNPTPAVTPSPSKAFMELSPTLEATITILSHQSRLQDVAAAWSSLVTAKDVMEAGTELRSAYEKMRITLGVKDGRSPELNFQQIVTDLKNGKLAPGGHSFAFGQLGQGMSIVECRQLTSTEISNRDQKQAAANATAAGGQLTFRDNLNLLKRDPADPASTWAQLVKCITAYGVLLAVLFTEDCPHFMEVWALRELIMHQDRHEEDYFTPNVCRHIVFAVLCDANAYFNHTYGPATLTEARIPFPASSLRHISNHVQALTAPPTPAHFPRKWMATSDGGSKGRFDGRGLGDVFGRGNGGGNDLHQGAFGAGGGPPTNKEIHKDFAALLEPLTNKYPNVPISDICTAANTRIGRLPYLNSAGSAPQMCYQHLFGRCTFRACRRYHASMSELNETPEFRKALCMQLEQGVKAILADGPPAQRGKKRNWNN